MTVGVPTPVDAQIESSIQTATSQGLAAIATSGRPAIEARYVIKYTGANYGGRYPPAPNSVTGSALYISPSPGFTWGAGLYACPIAFPISTGIYGRCGVVAELPRTAAWRIFDAGNPAVATLYVQWAQLQPMFELLTLSTHSQLANQLLRNMFRTRFQIDVVVFKPDELNPRYTRRNRDRWLAITEWSPSGRLVTSGNSTRALNAKLSIILAEEFEPTKSGIGRRAFIGPTPFLSSMEPTPTDVINAYTSSNLLWVEATSALT
jgi:hypothetical protein